MGHLEITVVDGGLRWVQLMYRGASGWGDCRANCGAEIFPQWPGRLIVTSPPSIVGGGDSSETGPLHSTTTSIVFENGRKVFEHLIRS